MSNLKQPVLFFCTVLLTIFFSHVTCAQTYVANQSDYAVTQNYYVTIIGKGSSAIPRLAQLNLFANLLPKGGDIHHHYSGALYAETYLDWVEAKGLCIDRTNYKVEFSVPPPIGADCLPAAQVRADEAFYRQLLMRWSDKDYSNHSHETLPPDQQFFKTFEYFTTISEADHKDGLLILKQRAMDEGLQYIETMLIRAPSAQPTALDTALDRLSPLDREADIDAELDVAWTRMENDTEFQRSILSYAASIDKATDGLDGPEFMLRTQVYVMRNDRPSAVFSSMYAGFNAAQKTDKLVGMNIVGAENNAIAMRDYRLHMRMLRYLKGKFPGLNLALHAGELSLGMVPPEGLRHHIREAVDIAGARRIGHGLDIAYESDADRLLMKMKQKKVAVEINLSSNALIAGVEGSAHPVTIYMQHGVPIVISTDDEGVSRSSISHEYFLFMSRYQPSYAVLKQTVYNSIRYSFLTQADQAVQIQLLDQRFTAFEKKIAAMVRGFPMQ